MRLTVGVTDLLPQWKLLLGQIGVPVQIVNMNQTVKPDDFSAVVIPRLTGTHKKDALLQYLSEGGSILMEADVAEWLLGISTVPAHVTYVTTEGDPIFAGILPGFVNGSFRLPRHGSALESDSGKKLVQILSRGKGSVLVLPSSLSRCVLDTRVRRRNFPSRGPLLPSERVSRQSKHTVREIIQRSLEYLYMKRGLPFVSLWPFPDGAKTLFNFRIDTDFASRENVDDMYELCHRHKIPATWFVETQSSNEGLSRFVEMENQEIGLHCYRHRVFSDFVRNEEDLKKGIRLLSAHRIRPKGYAAPFGQWNVPLTKALEHRGFTYSSEFCLDFDNLPFYPYLGDRFSPVLQVPIHPIATSRLRNAHHSDGQMKDYFKDMMEAHITHRLPIFVYDHPSKANLEVLNWLFKTVRKQNIPVVSLKEYAAWWEKRASIRWTAKWDKGKVIIEDSSSDSSVSLLIRRSMKEWGNVSMRHEVDLGELDWKGRKSKHKTITPMSERNALNRKMIVNDILHHYWKRRY